LKTFAILSGVLKILKKLALILYYFIVYIKYFELWALWEMKNSNAKVRIEQQIWNVPHEQQPRNLRQLRQAVILACQSLDAQMIQSAFSGMVNRARRCRCIGVQGHAFSDE
jgi:hypothetical protein